MKRRPPPCRESAPSGLRAGACGGLAVVLASFSLLLQAFLPLMPATPMASRTGMPQRAMASLCLTQDAAVPDPHGAPAGHEPDQGWPVCPLCLALHLAGAYVPPPPLAIPLPQLVHDVRAPNRLGTVPPGARYAAARARGPPIAA